MSVKLWKMSFKTVNKTVEDGGKKQGRKKKTTPTQANSSFGRATRENNLKIHNLIVKLLYPLHYLREPKMS